jgi:hypothetical protein
MPPVIPNPSRTRPALRRGTIRESREPRRANPMKSCAVRTQISSIIVWYWSRCRREISPRRTRCSASLGLVMATRSSVTEMTGSRSTTRSRRATKARPVLRLRRGFAARVQWTISRSERTHHTRLRKSSTPEQYSKIVSGLLKRPKTASELHCRWMMRIDGS